MQGGEGHDYFETSLSGLLEPLYWTQFEDIHGGLYEIRSYPHPRRPAEFRRLQ